MSTFSSITDRLKNLQQIGNFSDQEIELLVKYARITRVDLGIDGQLYPAWRIVHNNALGPGKGGIRFHPDVSEDEVRSLSFWMSIKNSLVGLPFGGAKGGIKFNPKEKTPQELERISRAYIDAMYPYLGSNQDIPAPDVNTDSQIMAWMLDQYEKRVGHHEPSMITGKPVELGGISLRQEATAKGGHIVLQEFFKTIGPNIERLTIAIQGFGNAGINIAKMLKKDGHIILAVSDSQGGTMRNKQGLDINALINLKQNKKSVHGYASGEKISNQELLELNVDVLILAAMENEVNQDNAPDIKAKYILELANGPITPEADQILFTKGIIILPDILANAGGVVTSYFEWVQNRTGNIFARPQLETRLASIMQNAFNRVWKFYLDQGKQFDLRTAAYVLAIKRILTAEKLRGGLG